MSSDSPIADGDASAVGMGTNRHFVASIAVVQSVENSRATNVGRRCLGWSHCQAKCGHMTYRPCVFCSFTSIRPARKLQTQHWYKRYFALPRSGLRSVRRGKICTRRVVLSRCRRAGAGWVLYHWLIGSTCRVESLVVFVSLFLLSKNCSGTPPVL